MDMSSPPHLPAQSHGRLVRIWISVLGGHEFLDGYEFLVDVSADMDMSPPPRPPAQSHGRWGGGGRFEQLMATFYGISQFATSFESYRRFALHIPGQL